MQQGLEDRQSIGWRGISFYALCLRRCDTISFHAFQTVSLLVFETCRAFTDWWAHAHSAVPRVATDTRGGDVLHGIWEKCWYVPECIPDASRVHRGSHDWDVILAAKCKNEKHAAATQSLITEMDL